MLTPQPAKSGAELYASQEMANKSSRSMATRTAVLESALAITAQYGMRGVTHRKVAQQAGVSLGVTSYHFDSVDSLLLEAFRMWVDRVSSRWDERFQSIKTDDDLIEAAVSVIHALHSDAQDAILLFELYAQSVRDESYRKLASEWSTSTRETIANFRDPETALRIEAAWEGIGVQLAMGSITSAAQGTDLIRRAVSGSLQGGTAAGCE